ncbi:MAG: hypothetical protein Ta2B_18780 [Termitinemataceae bacterium]|nr:MAG: hypothetical protein Ta2B_18780 [Termitinemataceae bacterium]
MKKTTRKWSKMLLVGMAAMVLTFGLSLSGCATYATVSGVTTPLGSLTSTAVNANRGNVIAEYKIILGLVTIEYEDFLKKIDGNEVDIIDTDYFGFYRIVKAVRRN